MPKVKHLDAPYGFQLPAWIVVHPADEGLMKPPFAGLAYCGERLAIVEGYLYLGKLIIRNPAALGHEVWHLLHCLYPEQFVDPDTLPEPFEYEVE